MIIVKKTEYGNRHNTPMWKFSIRQKNVLFTIPNYNLVSRPCIYKKGGGVTILVHKKIKYLTQEDLILTENNFELVFIEIISNNQKYNNGLPIRPPNTSETEFLNSYNELLNKFKLESKKVVLGLDHNLDLLKCHIHKSTENVLKINLKNNILPCITRPTHVTKTTATLPCITRPTHITKRTITLIDNILCQIHYILILNPVW